MPNKEVKTMKRSPSGNLILPLWFAFLIGGTFEQHWAYTWYPGVVRRSIKYFREKWWKAGYSYISFIHPTKIGK